MQENTPDAIFCANDEVAAALMTALRRLGFSISGENVTRHNAVSVLKLRIYF